jgi:hypothetical protein
MKLSSSLHLSLFLIVVLAVVSACNGDDEPAVDEEGATSSGRSAEEMIDLALTIEALPPAQREFLQQAAQSAGLPTMAPDEIAEIAAAMDAAKATATAEGFYVPSGPAATTIASGERVNATEAPNIAPIITYFFASAPDQAQAADGIRYFLNWTTQNANRVEIFGTVMDDPAEGSWPVYDESNDWVLWAANDAVWVESSLQVRPDQNTGATLQPLTVRAGSVTLTLRDPQFVDGDAVAVDVNGVRVINDFALGGRDVSFPVTLNSGQNTISIEARSVGVTPPMVGQIAVSDVSSGPGTQLTGGLNVGERQEFTITAP